MKIYESDERRFLSNGLGNVKTLSCYETKKKSLNGWFIEVELSSKYSKLICKGYLACVKTKEKCLQPFRIVNINKNDRVISFTANHVIFDAQNYLLDDVRPTNQMCNNFLEYLNSRLDSKSPFSTYSNIPTSNTKYFIRKDFLTALTETEELFSGTFDIDKFEISLNTTINNISNSTLIYGKNIQSMKVFENWDNVCTKLLPVGPNEIMLEEKYLISDISYEIPHTKTITFSIDTKNEDESDKTENEIKIELRKLGMQYLEEHKYPLLNYTVTSDIEQSLKIGDIIPVKHPLATFNTEVQEYHYNCITKKIESVVFGNYERNVAKSFSEIKESIKSVEKKSESFLTEAKNDVYYLMNIAGKNGSVVFKKNDKGIISELLFLDTNDMETAKTVMRINNQGLAGSTSGVNGPYNSAIMANGNIVADMINVGTLHGIKIIGNEITNGNNFRVDTNGNMTARNANFSGEITGSRITGSTINTTENINVGNNICLNLDSLAPYKVINAGQGAFIGFNYTEKYKNRSCDLTCENETGGLSNIRVWSSDKSNSVTIRALANGKISYIDVGEEYIGISAQIGIVASSDFTLIGNFSATGTKNRIVKTKNYGNCLLNAVESTTAIFEDNGNGCINTEGYCTIFFNEIFLQTINTKCDYFVQITKKNQGDLWCSEKTENYFIVEGLPGTKFDWNVKAKQRDYETSNLDIAKDYDAQTRINNEVKNKGEMLDRELKESLTSQTTFENEVVGYYESYMKEQEVTYE